MSNDHLMKILLISSHDQVTEWLMSTLRAEKDIMLAGRVPTLEGAIETAAQRQIDLVLLDAAVSDAKQLERLQALTASPMGPAVILMVDPSEVAFVQQALFAGARGFLLKPFTQAQLVESLHQAFSGIVQQRKALGGAVSAAPRPQSAQVLAVFSPKGGLGRTSVATNLAIALHQETRKPVTLVDGDLQFGDVDIAVNAIAHASIADLLGYVNELELGLLESALMAHPAGIRLLLAPSYFDPAFEASEGQLPHILKTMSALQEGYIVIDTPSGLSEATLSLLDIAQHVLLVTSSTLASLRATKRVLELASKLDYPPDKILIILNSYRKDTDLKIEQIEHHLNWPVTSIVPSDPAAMTLALSQGQPIVWRDKNHTVSKAFVKLARHLSGGVTSDATEKTEKVAASKRGASLPPMHIALNPKHALGA